MADTTALKNRIRATIKANNNQEITGPVLQQALLDIVDELDLNTELQEAINTEKSARQSSDEQLQQAIDEITPIEIHGDVTNAPDEEDLTSVNVGGIDVLKFKNKVYNSLTYSGLGRVYLRKNIVNSINVLTQEMMNKANTIYVIQYDFTLGENITVPENCVLKFDGGSLKNGNITFTNTLLIASESSFVDVDFTGTIKNDKKYLNWFAYTAVNKDYFNVVNYIVKGGGEIIFDTKEYLVDCYDNHDIRLDSNTILSGNGCILNTNYSATNIHALFNITSKDNITAKNMTIKGVESGQQIPPIGSTTYASSNVYAFFVNDVCRNLRWLNIKFDRVSYGIKSSRTHESDLVRIDNAVIENCNFICDMPLQGTGWCDIIISNCYFKSLGKNSGLHAIYITAGPSGTSNTIDKSNLDKKECIIFYNCKFYSPSPDGHVVQIYSYGEKEYKRDTFLINCILEGTTNPIITNSVGQKVYLDGCILKNENEDGSPAADYLECNNCDIKISLYAGIYKNCKIEHNKTVLNWSPNSRFSDAVFENCDINTSRAVIYDFESGTPEFINCRINTTFGDGLVGGYRGSAENPSTAPVNIKFKNCHITSSKVSYCPNNIGNGVIEFVNCNIKSTLNRTFAQFINPTSTESTTYKLVGCTFNNAEYNYNAESLNKKGTTANRPSNVPVGYVYIDETLSNKPIWWTGTAWVDATGTPV